MERATATNDSEVGEDVRWNDWDIAKLQVLVLSSYVYHSM